MSKISETLIIYLDNDRIIQWGILHNTGSFEKGIEEISSVRDREFTQIITIVPASDVLVIDVQLPKMSHHKLLQAIPYAIEENLLTDVSNLHFAIPSLKNISKEVNTTIPVAIVDKKVMSNWLDSLSASAIFPTSIIPSSLLLPLQENGWNILLENNEAHIRFDAYHGASCDINNLNDFLTSKLQEILEKPQVITIYHHGEKVNLTIDVDIIFKMLPHSSLEFLTGNINSQIINLLQGPYKTKIKNRFNKYSWRIISGLAASWLLLILLTNSVSYFALQHQAANLQTNIRNIYKENFPHATSMNAAKHRMTEKLNTLTNGGQKNNFLRWLSILAEAKTDTNFQIKELDYNNNILNLQFIADNFGTVDNVATALTKQGLRAKEQNVAEFGKQVKGVLTISEGNA